MRLSRVYSLVLEQAFGELCPRCEMPSSCGFCQGCRADFLAVPDPCCRCGLPLPVARCPARETSWRIDHVWAPYLYAAPLARFLRELKYRNRRSLGRALGLLLAQRDIGEPAAVDALVPVPLHPRRLRSRRYNQADEIAFVVASALQVPVLASGVDRTLDTPAQTELGTTARQSNLVDAFAVRRRLDGMRIAVVDDVMTTGATMNAMASALAAAGAVRIEAWAVARTERSGDSIGAGASRRAE